MCDGASIAAPAFVEITIADVDEREFKGAVNSVNFLAKILFPRVRISGMDGIQKIMHIL